MDYSLQTFNENVERPRPIHFKVDETTAKRVSIQGEATSSPARCTSQNKFEILRDHLIEKECDKYAVETRGEADGVAECANPVYNENLTTQAVAKMDNLKRKPAGISQPPVQGR